MNTWYYTLIFIFSCLTSLSLAVKFIFNLISNTPGRLILTDNEKIIYGINFAYLLTYLIYT
jgi:hypothetical protein